MADKIRLGIIGSNIHRGWAPRSHLPAVVASPEFELTAVCTTRMESAEESIELPYPCPVTWVQEWNKNWND